MLREAGYQPQAGNELATALPGRRDGTVSPEGGAGAAVLSMDVAAALAALGSSRRGLDQAEAARRRASGAPNTLPRPRRRTVAAELVAQLADMFAVVLMVAAGLTFLIYFLPRILTSTATRPWTMTMSPMSTPGKST